MVARAVEDVTPRPPADVLLSPPATLVMAPTALSSLVRSLPVFDALAAAGRRLVVVAPPPFHALLTLLPGVGGLIDRIDSEDLMVAALRAAGCQEAVVLEESVDAAWLLWQAGIPHRWGYGGWLTRRLLAPGVPSPTYTSSEERRSGARTAGQPYYQRLLQLMGVGAPRSWQPTLELPEDLRSQGQAYLERAQLPADCRVVGLVPGGERRLSHRWPWQSFAALAQALRRRIPNVRSSLFASATELWPAVRVHEETARFVPVLGPDLDLAELAATLGQARLVVGNDSGLLDLAAALGVPALVLTSLTARLDPLSGQEVLRGRSPGPVLSWVFRRSPLASLPVEKVLESSENLLEETSLEEEG
ncbi:MAG: glycosyltransferase family 9 protein [Acidobacteria bacterium]|nr:glycosyltransferase family 9 protein [Acidobacteriota bacterium]